MAGAEGGMDLESEELLSSVGPTPKPRSALRRGIAGTAAALTLLAVASWRFSPRVEKRSSGLGGLLQEFQLLDAWQMLSGGNPVKYICPMTVFQRMAAVALVGQAAEGDCCTTYDSVPMNLGSKTKVEYTFGYKTKFFDSVSFDLARVVLLRAGMPASMLNLLSSFYVGQRLSGFSCHCCDFWQQFVATPRVRTLAYQDDRTMLLAPSSEPLCTDPLLQASAKSRVFDDGFGFTCDTSKSMVVGYRDCESLASALGFPRSETLALLGVDHPLDASLPKTLSRLCVAKLKARMRYIPAFAAHTSRVCLLLRALCFSQNLTHESPAVLYHEVCGWLTHVQFCCDWATLSAGLRMHASRSAWLDLLPLPEALTPWYRVLPTVLPLLRRLQWSVSARGNALSWTDNCGKLRTFRLGFDGPEILKEWLLLPLRRASLARCGRTSRSLHRSAPGLATGLALPGPPPGSFLRAEGHCSVRASAETPALRRACLASGGSFWHLEPRYPRPQQLCLCGLRTPSRAHLTWCCPQTSDLRREIVAPQHRAAERLFAFPGEEVPPPPPCFDSLEHVQELAEKLSFEDETLVIATDGSNHGGTHGLGACSVVFPLLQKRFALSLPGEDQCSYKAELHALWAALSLALSARRPALRHIHLVCDCESAINAVLSDGFDLALQGLVCSIRALRAQLLNHGVATSLHWVSSHRKRPVRWIRWTGEDPTVQQTWNEMADDCAANACARLRRTALRASWLTRRAAAKAWEMGAIRAAAEAAERLAM
ncbi:PDE9A [Symbiodinium sp. CCMP2592]|nr:PDE9A [Symbiodinium sp. CCMP2592]